MTTRMFSAGDRVDVFLAPPLGRGVPRPGKGWGTTEPATVVSVSGAYALVSLDSRPGRHTLTAIGYLTAHVGAA